MFAHLSLQSYFTVYPSLGYRLFIINVPKNMNLFLNFYVNIDIINVVSNFPGWLSISGGALIDIPKSALIGNGNNTLSFLDFFQQLKPGSEKKQCGQQNKYRNNC